MWITVHTNFCEIMKVYKQHYDKLTYGIFMFQERGFLVLRIKMATQEVSLHICFDIVY